LAALKEELLHVEQEAARRQAELDAANKKTEENFIAELEVRCAQLTAVQALCTTLSCHS